MRRLPPLLLALLLLAGCSGGRVTPVLSGIPASPSASLPPADLVISGVSVSWVVNAAAALEGVDISFRVITPNTPTKCVGILITANAQDPYYCEEESYIAIPSEISNGWGLLPSAVVVYRLGFAIVWTYNGFGNGRQRACGAAYLTATLYPEPEAIDQVTDYAAAQGPDHTGAVSGIQLHAQGKPFGACRELAPTAD